MDDEFSSTVIVVLPLRDVTAIVRLQKFRSLRFGAVLRYSHLPFKVKHIYSTARGDSLLYCEARA